MRLHFGATANYHHCQRHLITLPLLILLTTTWRDEHCPFWRGPSWSWLSPTKWIPPSLDVLGRPLSSASQWADTTSLGRRSTFRTSTPTALLIDAVSLEVSFRWSFLWILETILAPPSPSAIFVNKNSSHCFPLLSTFLPCPCCSFLQTVFPCPSVSISLQNPLWWDQSRGIIVRSARCTTKASLTHVHLYLYY